jgi:predicted flavoprotein YhiN
VAAAGATSRMLGPRPSVISRRILISVGPRLRGTRRGTFLALVEQHGIRYHEKTLGQQFCDGSSRQIIDLLIAECAPWESRFGAARVWLRSRRRIVSTAYV